MKVSQFNVHDALYRDHNAAIMASRFAALLIWAAVAASFAYWGLRWLSPSLGVPPNASAVTLETGVRSDIHRLLTNPSRSPEGGPDNLGASAALGSRIKVIGVMAPAPGHSQGVALLSIDGAPPKAFRVGDVVDTGIVLQSLSQLSARFGPKDGTDLLAIDLPGLPAPTTGSLPPPSGITQESGRNMSTQTSQPIADYNEAEAMGRPAE